MSLKTVPDMYVYCDKENSPQLPISEQLSLLSIQLPPPLSIFYTKKGLVYGKMTKFLHTSSSAALIGHKNEKLLATTGEIVTSTIRMPNWKKVSFRN